MSVFEYELKMNAVEGKKTANASLPDSCYELAWVKDTAKVKEKKIPKQLFHADPVVIYNPHAKFHGKPIILMPLKPKVDDRKIETSVLPVRAEPQPKKELLTADHLNKFESNCKNILAWCLQAQAVLSQPNLDGHQLSKFSADCAKGKIYECAKELKLDILGTEVPQNMPQLVEPWQDVKAKTKDVVDTIPVIAQALKNQNSAEAIRLLEQVSEELNQALNDGFDRASAVADRLPKVQREISVDEMSRADKQKSLQVKILSTYQTLSYFVGTIESQIQGLAERPFGEMEASDWERLRKNYKTFKREMNGLRSELNKETMQILEKNLALTDTQKHLLKTFRQSLEKAMPYLEFLDKASPVDGARFEPVDSNLKDQMDALRKLSWKISGTAGRLSNELSLTKELKTAPDWKRPLLEQKLVLLQYYPLADSASDVHSAAWSLLDEADNIRRYRREDRGQSLRRYRDELLSATDGFRVSNNLEELQRLAEFDKTSPLNAKQIEQLRQFRYRYKQVQPEIEALRQSVQFGDSLDLAALSSARSPQLASLSQDRALIANEIREIDHELQTRELEKSTPDSLKPLLNQYNTYTEFSRITDTIDDISRHSQDILFLTGGLYSKQEAAVRLEEQSNKILTKISCFKNIVADAEKQKALSNKTNSPDLTPVQRTQLGEFYSHVTSLIPEIDQLENTVKQGADKHFWKLSKVVREHMEVTHSLGFNITLASFELHRNLSRELEAKKNSK